MTEVETLDRSFYRLSETCRHLAVDSKARVIVHQLDAHIDALVAQKKPWPPEVLIRLADVYEDLASVAGYLLNEAAGLGYGEKHHKLDELLVCQFSPSSWLTAEHWVESDGRQVALSRSSFFLADPFDYLFVSFPETLACPAEGINDNLSFRLQPKAEVRKPSAKPL